MGSRPVSPTTKGLVSRGRGAPRERHLGVKGTRSATPSAVPLLVVRRPQRDVAPDGGTRWVRRALTQGWWAHGPVHLTRGLEARTRSSRPCRHRRHPRRHLALARTTRHPRGPPPGRRHHHQKSLRPVLRADLVIADDVWSSCP